MRFEPGTRLDRYEIMSELGEGAYAETYQARDTDSGGIVVLKCPDPHLFADPHNFQRFRREAAVTALLDHPNVQRSVDDGSNRTEPYIVLEYIEGENLRSHMEALRSVPVAVAVDWGRQLAEGLVYLHSHGVVHRDLKPENVLIGPEGHLKITDFGTALLDGAKRLTWRHLSESIGTPSYMSPEQIQGNRGDERSDIYSWGVMMYEFLTGVVPFDGDNWMAVMAGHLNRTPERIRKLRPDVSPALEAVVLTAMRRDPAHRYASATALLGDLDRLDTLDASTFDLSPEPAVGGMAAVESTKRLWILIGIIAASFIGLVVAIVTIAAVLQ